MTQPKYSQSDVVGIEPKHITYVKDNQGRGHDMLVTKEVVHLKDGTTVDQLGFKEDYRRPYWVTQKGRQKHREKKDYEYASNCQKYTCTQLELSSAVARTMNDYSSGPNPPIRRLSRSPYLYGVDVSTPCLRKAEYRKKWPGLFSFNRVAAGDIETNVHSRENEIICMSATSKNKAILVYLKSWLGDTPDPIGQTHAMAKEHIGEILTARGIELEVLVVDTPADIVITVMNRMHSWKPEFFTFWNMDFDVTHMLRTLDNAAIDPATVFSDPSVPEQYRYCNYKRGPAQKTTASGKSMSINIEDRWNWITHPASFQIVDSMPIYRILRLTNGKDSSYALDYILRKELNMTKLKFDKVSHLSGLRWHEVMQEKYKIEYGVYNIFDSISLELLDEKTNDLASDVTLFSKNSDYKNFNSNPRRLCDDMHFWYLRRDEPCVIGSSSDNPVSELDKVVVGHSDWIVTLPSYMAAPTGLACIQEFKDYQSLIFTHVSDLDIVSTYPVISQALNIARETCVMEFGRMKGIREHERREVGVNLTAGRVNAIEICEKILGAPKLDDLLHEFKDSLGKKSLGGDSTGTRSPREVIVDSLL